MVVSKASRLIYHPDLFDNSDINLGSFKYESLGYIDNKDTSTQVAILKIISDTPALVIVFRGTDEIEDWHTNIHAYQTSFNNTGKVHAGFKKAYLSIRSELFNYLKNYNIPIFITGHSLGAALATLASSEICNNNNFDSCYTFGSPRVGNPAFSNSINCAQIYRVINNCDIVTAVPLDFSVIKYIHVGCPYLINDEGDLISNMNDVEIYNYKKDRLYNLKEYAKSKFLSKSFSSLKYDLPAFHADHSPLNYVIGL
ncbi:MAG TPA: lipase family protein [Thiotrichaceae bacterium]|nr:lipase family protein [Thiotrichaceae bacterium]HIM08436.1 lipase family protein [Gammaproteobacteria bacterium]